MIIDGDGFDLLALQIKMKSYQSMILILMNAQTSFINSCHFHFSFLYNCNFHSTSLKAMSITYL